MMKIAAGPSPAFCQLPLIEVSRPTVQEGAINSKWRPSRFLVRMGAKIWDAIISRVPVGYEDETGFHHVVSVTHDR